jgi:hypothetical protein
MGGTSVAVWLAVAGLAGRRVAVEVLFGMLGPLAVATITLAVAGRIYRQSPERLTGFMITAFGAKLLFFGVYVALALSLLQLRPGPFLAGFTGYFIALHVTEAFCLRRLFSGDTRASR